MNSFHIQDRAISERDEPFIIAELSGNHLQDFDKACLLIEKAKEAGVDAIKLQTYTADTITMLSDRPEFMINDEKSLWKGSSLHALYKKAYTPWQWHEKLFQKASSLGLIAFSTPFDLSSVAFLETLNPPCYKIASNEIVDLPLIEACGLTKKPLIISCGMASLAEIEEAISTARKAGSKEIILLKCTSAYPAPESGMNIRTIPHMRDTFSLPVGLSDHSLGIGVAISAIALGACVIEKHLTLNRSEGGPDAAFSLEPAEFTLLVQECKRAFHSLGTIHYGPISCEETTYQHRKSLYFTETLAAGSYVKAHNIRSIRPANGLPPKFAPCIIGMKLAKNVAKGDPVCWTQFQE
jgi:N-acetylneuraminate synthase